MNKKKYLTLDLSLETNLRDEKVLSPISLVPQIGLLGFNAKLYHHFNLTFQALSRRRRRVIIYWGNLNTIPYIKFDMCLVNNQNEQHNGRIVNQTRVKFYVQRIIWTKCMVLYLSFDWGWPYKRRKRHGHVSKVT